MRGRVRRKAIEILLAKKEKKNGRGEGGINLLFRGSRLKSCSRSSASIVAKSGGWSLTKESHSSSVPSIRVSECHLLTIRNLVYAEVSRIFQKFTHRARLLVWKIRRGGNEGSTATGSHMLSVSRYFVVSLSFQVLTSDISEKVECPMYRRSLSSCFE